jgi:hypothetical protein
MRFFNIKEFEFYRTAHFYWLYAKKKACTDLRSEWMRSHRGERYSLEDELVLFKKFFLIPLELLKKTLSDKLKAENVLVRTKDFGNIATFEIDFNGERLCRNIFKENIYLIFINISTEKNHGRLR